MKILTKISLLLAFFFLINFAFAGGEEKRSITNPAVSQQQGDKKQNTKELDLSENLGESEQISQHSIDSTEDDSVSKYNFIFYFLYKLKYDEGEEIEALL